METTVMPLRGFSNSYIPDKKIDDVMDFQFVQGSELERLWKQARRERLKVQEDKIWEEFVTKDQDVLQTIVKEDQYQFIDESIPETCLEELIHTEVERPKEETEQEQVHGAGDSLSIDSPSVIVDDECDRAEAFNIFDEKDDDFTPDDDGLEEIDEPCTVRERMDIMTNRASGPSEAATERNSETNMATMIESSIYCAKVKNLRAKIKEELLALIPSLENLNLAQVDWSTVRKMRTRAAEYAGRFQRIHLYQLTRHVHDLERHNAQAMPFAKHTQFQSQMVRIVALHTNTLQSIQVFHKSLEQTACLCECADQLCALCALLRDSVLVCTSVSVPHNFNAAKELYNDDLVAVCDQVEKCVNEYKDRVADIVKTAEENAMIKKRDREMSRLKRKNIGTWSKNATKNSGSSTALSDPRLSMYSLETISKRRPAPQPKRDNKDNLKKEMKKDQMVTKTRKSPRSRRPLMRAPSGTRRREVVVARLADQELHTMVEAVDVTASLLSNEVSPNNKTHGGLSRCSPYKPRPGAVPPSPPRGRSPPSPRSARRLPDPPRRSDASAPAYIQGIPTLPLDSSRTATVRGGLSDRDDKKEAKLESSDVPNYDVNTILRQLCGGDGLSGRGERISGAKNAQLLNFSSNFSPRQPTTPQLLRILEETIQKKAPKPMRRMDSDRLRLAFNTPQHVADHLFQYRTKFVQHMLASSMYANSTVNKPWEFIGSGRGERISGAKNAQLLNFSSNFSPRQPTTPQLLRILEETIQKKAPKPMRRMDSDRLRLAFNTPQHVADHLFQYRTKFVQHMLASSMYANSTVNKPWEFIGRVADQMIMEILVECAWEMELVPMISQLYLSETKGKTKGHNRE